MNKRSLALIAGSIFITSINFAQKTNETSAAVEYKQKFQPAWMMGKVDDAKASLLTAKKYIDLAAEHPETKGTSKTLYYKGEIYGAAAQVAMMTGDTSFLTQNFGQDAFEVSITSLRESYLKDKKFRKDIEASVNMQTEMIQPMAGKFYEENKFAEAGAAFYYVYKIGTAKNAKDSVNLYNAGLCFERAEMFKEAAEAYEELTTVGYKKGEAFALAAAAYAKLGNHDKAIEILQNGKAKFGNDKTILLELVRVNIAKGDNVAAEKSLNDAIDADPKNKQLHYIIGTIYTDLGQDEKAEEALLKALEIDPNYADAQYNLGAHYVTWATKLRDEANEMNPNDFKYDLTLAKSQELYKKALDPLEAYITKQPKDANVLLILFQINQNLGDSEKAKEYKDRYDNAVK